MSRKDAYKKATQAGVRPNAEDQVGVVGRRTGIVMKTVGKDSQGFDSIDELFAKTPKQDGHGSSAEQDVGGQVERVFWNFQWEAKGEREKSSAKRKSTGKPAAVKSQSRSNSEESDSEDTHTKKSGKSDRKQTNTPSKSGKKNSKSSKNSGSVKSKNGSIQNGKSSSKSKSSSSSSSSSRSSGKTKNTSKSKTSKRKSEPSTKQDKKKVKRKGSEEERGEESREQGGELIEEQEIETESEEERSKERKLDQDEPLDTDPASCLVIKAGTNQERNATVAIYDNMQLCELEDGPNSPLGGKMFDHSSFSAGILSLPGLSAKAMEFANTTELFYVVVCPLNALSVQIHKTLLILSEGDSFTVPKGNHYKLTNLSSEPIKLYFVLLKQIS